jgi:5,6-dimethylbenzimidazole synthase
MIPPAFDSDFREQFATLLRWRRDVRQFRTDPLPEDLLDQLLALAHLAPSVGLSQPWRFVIVGDAARRAAVRADFEACNAEALASYDDERAGRYARLKLAGFDSAPCHVAVFVEPAPEQGHRLGRLTMPEVVAYSAVTAIHTLWLAARAHGVGLGWVSILQPSAVAAALDVPDDWRFIGYLCLGYPASEEEVPELERQGWEVRRPAGDTIIRR